jgi:hypothetical protein
MLGKVGRINKILNYLINDVCNSEGIVGVNNVNFMFDYPVGFNCLSSTGTFNVTGMYHVFTEYFVIFSLSTEHYYVERLCPSGAFREQLQCSAKR